MRTLHRGPDLNAREQQHVVYGFETVYFIEDDEETTPSLPDICISSSDALYEDNRQLECMSAFVSFERSSRREIDVEISVGYDYTGSRGPKCSHYTVGGAWIIASVRLRSDTGHVLARSPHVSCDRNLGDIVALQRALRVFRDIIDSDRGAYRRVLRMIMARYGREDAWENAQRALFRHMIDSKRQTRMATMRYMVGKGGMEEVPVVDTLELLSFQRVFSEAVPWSDDERMIANQRAKGSYYAQPGVPEEIIPPY